LGKDPQLVVHFDMFGAGRWLYVQRDAQLEARSFDTGTSVWNTSFPVYAPDPNAWAGTYGARLAIGPGLLLTVAGRQLTAYISAFHPGPTIIQALPDRPVVFGQRANILGAGGASLVGAGVDFVAGRRALGHTRVQPDGLIQRRLTVSRNTRMHAVAKSSRSRSFEVFVYPHEHDAVKRAGPRSNAVTVTLRGPRSIPLAGRIATLYLGRVGARRYQRLGHGRLLAVGRGRARTRVVFPALRTVGNHDFLATCVDGQARLGLGDPLDPLLRKCGLPSTRF
jgi:hypothetical protein